MSGELDAAGAMASAGLAAGAIEGREPGEAREGACLNCGAVLGGRFCANCGQASCAHRSLSHVIEEFLHGIFHFDTKVWRTLPMLIARPGTLTRNYTYGRRARYVSPLALFLLAVFFMFFVFAFVDVPIQLDGPETRADPVEQLAEAQTALAEAERELTQAQAEPEGPYTPGLEVRLARQAVGLARAEVGRRTQALERVDAAAAAPTAGAGEETLSADAEPADAPAAEQTWQENLQAEVRAGEVHVNSGFPVLDARILRALENPDLALYMVQEAASTFSFLLVPISLPFMALLFLWKRGLTLYDHVVFTLNSLSFASLVFVLIAISMRAELTEGLFLFLLPIGLPAHMFFHLKGAYALGWWSAIWRTLFLLVFAWIALCIFVLAIVLLGLAG